MLDNTTQPKKDLEKPPTARPSLWHSCRRIGLGLLLAAASPLAMLAPTHFARWFERHFVAVPLWQIVGLITWAAYEIAEQWSRGSISGPGLPPWFYVAILVPYLVILGLAWLIAAFMARPMAAEWDETPRRSLWKSGMLLLAFCLPIPLLLAGMDDLLRLWIDMESEPGWRWYSTISGAVIMTLCFALPIQVVRGLAALGGRREPVLPPLCRDCGYSLEGVTELWQAQQKGDDGQAATPTVCSECGCELSASLDPATRQGTAWTRGESLALAALLRTLTQILRQPSRFFADLPLGSSRRAALWFWLGTVLATFLLLTAVLATDYAVCRLTDLAEPLLPTDVRYARYDSLPDSDVRMSVGASLLLWLLDCYEVVAGIALATWIVGLLALSLTATQICRTMTRHRSANMYPAGLLLQSYLSPVALVGGTVFAAVGLSTRLAAVVWLPHAPAWVRRLVDAQPEPLAIMAGMAAMVPVLVWYHVLIRRATKSLQYANR